MNELSSRKAAGRLCFSVLELADEEADEEDDDDKVSFSDDDTSLVEPVLEEVERGSVCTPNRRSSLIMDACRA